MISDAVGYWIADRLESPAVGRVLVPAVTVAFVGYCVVGTFVLWLREVMARVRKVE